MFLSLALLLSLNDFFVSISQLFCFVWSDASINVLSMSILDCSSVLVILCNKRIFIILTFDSSSSWKWLIWSLEFGIGRSTLVGQCPMKSLSTVCWSVCPLVCLSVRQSVHPSVTKSCQDLITSFFLILYMMITVQDIYWLTKPDFWKKFDGPNLAQMGQNQVRNCSLLPFFQVWFISFPWNCIQWYLSTISNI